MTFGSLNSDGEVRIFIRCSLLHAINSGTLFVLLLQRNTPSYQVTFPSTICLPHLTLHCAPSLTVKI
jgi:hypothetical protein